MEATGRGPLEVPALVRCGVGAFAACTLFSGAALYLHNAWGGPRPLLFILAVVAAAGALAALDPHRPAEVLRSPLLLWVYAYLLLSTAWALWRPTLSGQTDQALVDRWRCMAFLVAMAVVFDDPRARKVGGLAVVAVALASSVVNMAEAAGLVAFADPLRRNAGRAAGLYVNPNQAGIAIVFGLAAGLAAVPRALRLPVLVACAGGVAATFSRSAALCLSALVLVLLCFRQLPVVATLLAGLGLAAAVGSTGGRLERILEAGGALNQDTLARLSMTADDSGRAALAQRAWRMFAESPWVGYGLASEREGRISHNVYLSLAAEHGVLGFLLVPALAAVVAARRRSALGFAVVFLLTGLFSHNLLEGEWALLCVALVASEPAAEPAAEGAGALRP